MVVRPSKLTAFQGALPDARQVGPKIVPGHGVDHGGCHFLSLEMGVWVWVCILIEEGDDVNVYRWWWTGGDLPFFLTTTGLQGACPGLVKKCAGVRRGAVGVCVVVCGCI
jgi:hypothetical protein